MTKFGDTFLLPGDATASWATIDWERLPEDHPETLHPVSNPPKTANLGVITHRCKAGKTPTHP